MAATSMIRARSRFRFMELAFSRCPSGKTALGIPCKAELCLAEQLSDATDALYDAAELLDSHLRSIPEDRPAAASYYHDVILQDMAEARSFADVLEQLTDKKCWPYPTYSDLLFY